MDAAMVTEETVSRDYDDSFEEKPALRTPVLIVLRGTDVGRRYLLNERALVIGRDPSRSAITVADGAVSGRHCRIDAALGIELYALTDLESRNGTRVNGERIDRTELKDGDRIFIGDTILKFTFQDTVEQDFHAELDTLMNVDTLTGLPVLRLFDRELRRIFRRLKEQPLSILMMDMDGLKRINDQHGHQTGARCIAEVGKLIGKVLGTRGMASRFGGDEFVAFLPDCAIGEAEGIAETIRRNVENHAIRQGQATVSPTISVGVAQRTPDVHGPEELIRLADDALYRAKRGGRNAISR
jgi:diguanylate cyclase (GGDEF)-like protein